MKGSRRPPETLKTVDPNDYPHALTGGPWVIYRHYLMVQPWTASFSVDDDRIMSVVAWVQFLGLPIQYYHKGVFRAIAKTIGTVVRINYNTESLEHGKFVRLAVSVDLTKPLVSKIWVEGHFQRVEYEGLPTICFKCSCYDHLREQCPMKPTEITVEEDNRGEGSNQTIPP